MRNVIFHLTSVSQQVFVERLSEIAAPSGPQGWHLPRGASLPVLYIDLYNDLLTEAEPGEIDTLRAALGSMPSVSVSVHVSGRVPGDAEILDFAAWVLGEFGGVAWDCFTPHCWTLREIQSGVKVDEHSFFDYAGWHPDLQHQPTA